LQLTARRLVPALLGMAGATVAALLALRLLLGVAIDTTYHQDEVLRGMHLSRSTLPITVPDTLAEAADALPALDRIRSSGVLRVAFVAGRVPFGFRNERGDLVGLDVDLAERLARDLGATRLELVPADFSRMAALLAARQVDIAMGLPYLPTLLPRVAYSVPYLDSTLGLVVADHRREAFASLDALRQQGPLTVAVLTDLPGIQQRLRDSLPGVDLRFVTLDSPADFLAGRASGVDAFAMLAEAGAAWSLLFPAYSVVVPQPNPVTMPVGVALRRGDDDLAGFIDDWLVIQRASGHLKQARDYWVLGRGAQPRPPRWSVLHDVLGWGRRPAATNTP